MLIVSFKMLPFDLWQPRLESSDGNVIKDGALLSANLVEHYGHVPIKLVDRLQKGDSRTTLDHLVEDAGVWIGFEVKLFHGNSNAKFMVCPAGR